MKLYSPKHNIIHIWENITDFTLNPRFMKLKNHRRFCVYHTYGVKCVSCGIEANALVKWTPVKFPDQIHYDLFYLGPNRQNVLMTIDHIKPRSLGGDDSIENLQPMCAICNTKKGNKYDTLR